MSTTTASQQPIKPTYVDLFTRLHFDDWKRLRTSTYESLRLEDKEAIVRGILIACHTLDIQFLRCLDCGTFAQIAHKEFFDDDLTLIICQCGNRLTSKDLVKNLHAL